MNNITPEERLIIIESLKLNLRINLMPKVVVNRIKKLISKLEGGIK